MWWSSELALPGARRPASLRATTCPSACSRRETTLPAVRPERTPLLCMRASTPRPVRSRRASTSRARRRIRAGATSLACSSVATGRWCSLSTTRAVRSSMSSPAVPRRTGSRVCTSCRAIVRARWSRTCRPRLPVLSWRRRAASSIPTASPSQRPRTRAATA